jgi:hypothetical protein
MESLKEGVKFVFNKTILGALSLDMIAVLLVERCIVPILQDIFESRPTGIWCFESCSGCWRFLMLIISAFLY